MDDTALAIKKKIDDLRNLTAGTHWFCPRQYDGDATDYGHIGSLSPSENRALTREQLVHAANANRRAEAAISCLRILTMESEDLASAAAWYKRHLGGQMAKCDTCVRVYHLKKKRFIESLAGEHDEDEVAVFAKILGDFDLDRIRSGLMKASQALHLAKPPQRGISALEGPSLFAIFEALSAEAVLTDEGFMMAFLDDPFGLVQTNRLLKLNDYVPAMGRFLFDPNDLRRNWARRLWAKMKRPPTKEEFWWVVQEPLLAAMRETSTWPIEEELVARLWTGINLIVNRLDQPLIRHSLRGLDVDVYRLALEHLPIDSSAFSSILGSLHTLLIKSPADFWEAMGAISPAAIVEGIYNAKEFARILKEADELQDYEQSPLRTVLAWVEPFMASLKPPRRPPACRALATQLMERFQTDDYPDFARMYCFQTGLEALSVTLQAFADKKLDTDSNAVRRVVMAELMETVIRHIEPIMTVACVPQEDESTKYISGLSMDIVRHTLVLDTVCLKIDHDTLEEGSPLHDTKGWGAGVVWQAAANALTRNDVRLARNILIGMIGLVGLEKFNVTGEVAVVGDKIRFNRAHDELLETTVKTFEGLSDFDPDQLAPLFEPIETAMPLIASLFAADSSVYRAGTEIIKVVSAQSGRREALAHLVRSYFATTISCLSWTIYRIAKKRIFAPNPRMLKTSADIFDLLCNVQDGILNAHVLSSKEAHELQLFWEHQWTALAVIFKATEVWGRANDRDLMKEFCRDTMQFAENCFEKYHIFATAIGAAEKYAVGEGTKAEGEKGFSAKKLLEHPTSTLEAMVEWLRLKDDYLADVLASLVAKMLRRLHENGLEVGQSTRRYIEDVCIRNTIRVILSPQQKAELRRALDEHLNRKSPPLPELKGKHPSVAEHGTLSERRRATNGSLAGLGGSTAQAAAGIIDLEKWQAKAKESQSSDDTNKPRASSTRDGPALGGLEKLKAWREARTAAAPPPKSPLFLTGQNPAAAAQAQRSFREKRERERQEKAARDQEQLARLKKEVGRSSLAGPAVSAQPTGSGSSSMMVSSESDEDDDEQLDEELFGLGPSDKVSEGVQQYRDSKMRALKEAQQRGPVKKIKRLRDAKDMRARLAPDLTTLHQTILSWDFFHAGEFPPNLAKGKFTLVSNTFRTPHDYQATFQPLLILEAWQGFLKAKEDAHWKPFDVKVASHVRVDAFVDIGSAIPPELGRDLGLGEADIVLMCRGGSPAQEPNQPHCLARIIKILRKKGVMEVTFRMNSGNPLQSYLSPNSTVRAVKVNSITPLEREYGALLGLQYYDLCEEIISAKPSPILKYSDDELSKITQIYSLNKAQSKAVRSAMDNDGFTLIQGPPGSGKTKTIVAVVGALLTRAIVDKGVAVPRPNHANASSNGARQLASKKLLVCAPSNAAVDELVMRLKDGVKTLYNTREQISVVRLGRSDAINANVLDVTLEELVSKKLEVLNGQKVNYGEEIHKLVEESRAVTESQALNRRQLEEARAKCSGVSELQRESEILRRKKAQIGTKLDELRDKSSTASRDADINRRRVQQAILDGAHIICATLSGSGHEMLQTINIEFETVIIDEAAQSIELSALIPLKYGCSKCILVGDPKQLPPTVLSREAARFAYEQSLFVRMQANHPDDVHLLDTQYRMHPEITRYPSQAFYDGRLLDGDQMDSLRAQPWHQHGLLGPYRFFDVQGQHQSATKGHSLINVAELNVAMQLYERLIADFPGYDFSRKIGIITPYKGQLVELKVMFSRRFGEDIFKRVEFNTTDAFQGRESEIIIFSCVRASSSGRIGFLDDIRRMNVGLTRAKSSLWVLGNSRSLEQNEFWGKLINDARTRDRYTAGDILEVLRKPLPRLPALPPKPSVGGHEGGASRRASKADVEMTDAPTGSDGGSTSRSNSLAQGDRGKAAVKAEHGAAPTPSGGSGLNSKGACRYCGSLTHHGDDCENEAALTAGGVQCFRCQGMGHVVARCAASLCTMCGEVGHTRPSCTGHRALSNNEQAALRQQERHYESQKRMYLSRQQQRQVGDHNPHVPMIRPSEAGSVPNGPSRPAAKAAPDRSKQPAPSKSGLPPPPPDLPPPPPDLPLKPANAARLPDIREANAALGRMHPKTNGAPFVPGDVPHGAAATAPPPRGPPPPRKRKEVDPFIRPNRKRPRS